MGPGYNRGKAYHKLYDSVTRHSFSLISIIVYILIISIFHAAAIPDGNLSANSGNITSSNFTQSTSISGYLEVSDVINNIGNVDLSLIENSIYNQNGVSIWQIAPDTSYPYLSGLRFYAKLDKNSNELSIMLSGDDKSKSLRGMIPSINDAQDTTLSSHPDLAHYCYPYDHSKTLIYSLLKDSFNELKTNSVINSNALLSNDPIYKCSFTDKVYIFGYYITSTDFNNDNFCYHNWPWGTGTDQCKYGSGSYICDYSTGTVQVTFDFNLDEPKNYYLYGFIDNDNREETQYLYNNNMWLHQVDYGPGSTEGEKYGSSDFPTNITLYGHKTWSANRLMTWVAIDANSISANGHITGDGPTHVDRSEDPDVLDSIALEKEPIVWPLSVPSADLYFKSIALRNADNKEATVYGQGEPVYVDLTLSNKGQVSVDSTKVAVYIKNEKGSIISQTDKDIENILPGSDISLEMQLQTPSLNSDVYTVQAVVDPDNLILNEDKSNNIITTQLKVLVPGNLVAKMVYPANSQQLIYWNNEEKISIQVELIDKKNSRNIDFIDNSNLIGSIDALPLKGIGKGIGDAFEQRTHNPMRDLSFEKNYNCYIYSLDTKAYKEKYGSGYGLIYPEDMAYVDNLAFVWGNIGHTFMSYRFLMKE